MSQTLDLIRPYIRKHFQLTRTEFVPGKTRIPLTVPTYGSEEVEEAVDSLLSTWVSMGAKVKKFEEAFAKYNGSKHAVMVNSGSSANLLALATLTNPLLSEHIEKGSEIITPAVTWATTIYPIVNVGCIPVLVDVDPRTFNIIPELLEKAVNPKTKAIVPVHLLGGPCQIDEIDRGMIVTDNDELHEYLKAMRAFGWVRDLRDKNRYASENKEIDSRFLFVTDGYNFRPTEIQGAFGVHQIKKLDKFIETRRRNAAYWSSKLSSYSDMLILPEEQLGTKHVYFGYHLTVTPEAPFDREQLVSHLESRLIETRPIMAGNIAEQPVMTHLSHRISGTLDNSRMIMRNSFFFGNHMGIGEEEREYIAESIVDFANRASRQ